MDLRPSETAACGASEPPPTINRRSPAITNLAFMTCAHHQTRRGFRWERETTPVAGGKVRTGTPRQGTLCKTYANWRLSSG
jgi:hypothetical protein